MRQIGAEVVQRNLFELRSGIREIEARSVEAIAHRQSGGLRQRRAERRQRLEAGTKGRQIGRVTYRSVLRSGAGLEREGEVGAVLPRDEELGRGRPTGQGEQCLQVGVRSSRDELNGTVAVHRTEYELLDPRLDGDGLA